MIISTSSFALGGLLLSSTASAAATLGATKPIVKLHAGEVHGAYCSNNSRTKLYQGIPFAEPPVGKLRFMPPKEKKGPYPGGKLDATKPSTACMQFPSPFGVDGPTSEDCLYLDVYVPSKAKPNSKLPVKVWAYGGSNVAGGITYPLYDACNLATDSIVVSFNYRLSALGFLGLEAAGIKGNMALQDYLMALKWVKANIASFGGDTKKVMLFGQSAGAYGTWIVSTLPEAKHLISSATMQSGGGIDLVPHEAAQIAGSDYAEALGCKKTDLECLQSKPIAEIVAATEKAAQLHPDNPLSDQFAMNIPNSTSVDGFIHDGEIIKVEPLKAGSKVPIIVGAAQNEGALFTSPIYGKSGFPVTEQNYTDFASLFGPDAAKKILKKYPLSMFNATGSTEVAVIEATSHIVATAGYICETYKGMRSAMLAGTPAYAYRWNHTPSCPWLWADGETVPPPHLGKLFGPTHTSEINFVFANLDNQPFQNGTCNATAPEREISKKMVGAWTAMAEKQSPATSDQAWPRFDKCQGKGLYIEDKVQIAKLDFSECAFWDDIWVELGGTRVPGA